MSRRTIPLKLSAVCSPVVAKNVNHYLFVRHEYIFIFSLLLILICILCVYDQLGWCLPAVSFLVRVWDAAWVPWVIRSKTGALQPLSGSGVKQVILYGSCSVELLHFPYFFHGKKRVNSLLKM